MPSPNWVDFASAERSAAVMARRLSGPSEAWGTLLANAQAVLTSWTDTPHSELPSSYNFHEWRDLVAAARILDLAATELGLTDQENRRAAAILAACAFGMSGTAVSATAIIRGHPLLNSDLSAGELVALALSSPIVGREVYTRLPIGSKHRTCIGNVLAFLARGDVEEINAATRVLQEVIYEEPGAWESYLLRLSRLSLAHAGRLAAIRVLGSKESIFPRGYLDRLVADSPLLLPSQYQAVTESGVLSTDQNVLIALPTATGKTLLGELALLSSLGKEPGLVCYIAPYVALGRQVAEKISSHTPSEVRVHRLVGGYREPVPLDPENHLEVLVATPERFDAMLRLRPELLSSIRCVVFDEAHMIGNSQRGVRLEGILTRLRLASHRGSKVPRFILLSAVLSNADALADWIDIKPTNIIRGTWRPSAKRLLRWTEDGMLRLHAGDDPLRDHPSEVLGETQLPWPNTYFYSTSNFGAIRKQESRALENVAYLAEFEHNQYQQPVLCVCSTRPRTRRLADQIAQRFASLEPPPQEIVTITDLIDQRYPYLRPLKEALRRGVAYHNSSLPHDVREGIERAVEGRALKVVAATTTLAEGVDLPFRATILADWLMFDGEKNRPMESLLFKNIAGRCGRAGQFTEGDTIVFDNPVGDAQLTSPARRPSLQQQIFFSAAQPNLTSAISRLDRQIAVSAVGSQLLAAIAENPELDNVDASFLSLSFARQTEGAAIAADRIELAYGEILDDADGRPLAVAASPARLTPFGEAASSSGLSPATARRLRTALGEITDQGSSRASLIAISVALLKSLGDVIEQENPDLRKAVKNPRSRPVVRLKDLELVLDLWLSGEHIETIFAELPTNKRSRRKPGLGAWLQGVPEDSTWTDQFAKFYDFVSNCVEFFLPWVLRAARPLAEIDDQPERPWREWARFAEVGMDSISGVQLLDAGAVTERKTAREIGKRLDVLMTHAEPTIERVQQILIDIFEEDYQAVEKVLNWYRQQGDLPREISL